MLVDERRERLASLQAVEVRLPHAPAAREVVVGEVGVVRRQQQPVVVEAPQRRLRRQRLDLEDVEGGAGQPPRRQRPVERRLVDGDAYEGRGRPR